LTAPTDPAIAQAYRVFARYRAGAGLDFAAQPSLREPERERLRRVLTTTPLRDLPYDAIEAYFDYIDAAHDDGAFRADEVRYFLPRALELLAHEGRAARSWLRDCLDRSLARAAVRTAWPADEVEAIARVFGADELP
jgi:hypothetical protein